MVRNQTADLHQSDVSPVEIELLGIAGPGALHVVDLGAVPLVALVVGQQGVVVLVHAEVHHVPPVPHVEALVAVRADVEAALARGALAQLLPLLVISGRIGAFKETVLCLFGT